MSSVQGRKRGPRGLVSFLLIALIAVTVWLGIARQGELRAPAYPDRGDAYSEQIIRNTVMNAFIGVENASGSLIWTQGYPGDIAYDPLETRRYHSQVGMQAEVYKVLAGLAPEIVTTNFAGFFDVMRFLSCLAICVVLFLLFLPALGSTGLALIGTAAMSLSAGVAMFGANLYWQYWMIFTPLISLNFLLKGNVFGYVLVTLVVSVAYFCVRYEFATTFALMSLLPVILASRRGLQRPILVGLAGFAAVCTGFVIAVAFHHYRVTLVEDVSFWGASEFVFENVGLRLASLDRVPFPLSAEFMKNIALRLTENAFGFEDIFTLSRGLILLFLVAICAWLRTREAWLVLSWSLVTYASWYIFAYQHIMQHYAHDGMLFSATVGLAFVYMALRCFGGSKGATAADIT